MRKITSLLMLCLMALGLTANAQTLDLTNSSNVYTVDSEKRGYLYYDEAKSTTYILSTWLECGGTESTSHPKADGSVTNNQFAFIKSTTSGKVYMYSVAANKFLKQSGTNIVLTEDPEASVTLTANGTYYLIAFESGDEINFTNWDYNTQGIRVANADPDGGNKMTIALVSTSVDLSAAIEKVNPAVTPAPDPEAEPIKASDFAAEKVYVIKNVSSSRSGYLYVGNDNALCIGNLDDMNNAPNNYLFKAMPTNSGLVLKAVEGGYVPTGDGAGTNLSATTVSEAAVVTVAAKGGTYPETTLNMLVNGNYCNVNPGAFCTWNDKNDANGVWEFYAIEEIANVEAAQMTTVTTLAEQALTLDGVGYPVASERENLNNTVAAAKAFNTSGAWYEEMVNTLTAYASTTNIKLPEDGKAYIFKNVMHTGDVSYFNCTIANGITIVANEASATPFICKNVGDNKFVFVTNDGKYMTWKGGKEGYNNNLGYTDSYDTSAKEWSHLTIEKLVSGGYTGSATAQDMFGLVAIKGRRNNLNEDMNYFVVKNASSFDHADSMFFMKSNGNNFSSGFQMIEVEYPNKPVVNDAQGVENVAAISTFCAPFATVAPGNVDVYIAASDESHYIKLQKVEGAVPANTGVVLVSEDNALAGQAITMVPATTETLADVTGNLLRGDAANGDYTVDAAVNAYVLGAVDGVAGFYPLSASDRTIKQGKAYLVLDETLSAVKLYFGGDDVTGIETVEKAEKSNAPIFDLSGRRVVNVAKGGIYIQNGKKFFVK